MINPDHILNLPDIDIILNNQTIRLIWGKPRNNNSILSTHHHFDTAGRTRDYKLELIIGAIVAGREPNIDRLFFFLFYHYFLLELSRKTVAL